MIILTVLIVHITVFCANVVIVTALDVFSRTNVNAHIVILAVVSSHSIVAVVVMLLVGVVVMTAA